MATSARGHLPARLARVLGSPVHALADIDREGGGVRDAAYLVLVGLLAFRSRELASDILALSHVPVRDVLAFALGTASRETREAAFIVLPAAVAITLFAGRGRRDPGRDLELGGACYVPFFAVRAVVRAVEQRDWPLPPTVKNAAFLLALVWSGLLLAFAVRTARTRARVASPESPVVPAPSGPPSRVQSGWPSRSIDRIAVTALAAVVGVALTGNAVWIARNAHAILPLATGVAASEFTLPRVDGQPGSVSLASLKGKVVLLDFWATWCPPCKVMIPTLHELHAEWSSRGVEFVGIHSPDVPAAEIRGFLAEHPAPYPVVQDDPDGSVAQKFKVMALPHFVVLDRAGAVFQVFFGYTAKNTLAQALAAAASAKG